MVDEGGDADVALSLGGGLGPEGGAGRDGAGHGSSGRGDASENVEKLSEEAVGHVQVIASRLRKVRDSPLGPSFLSRTYRNCIRSISYCRY